MSEYDPPLDPGIAPAVEALGKADVETFESCEGGEGHAYGEPTVRFHGEIGEGFRALAVALEAGLAVTNLRRSWMIQDGEAVGPWWELTFAPTRSHAGAAIGRVRSTTYDHGGRYLCFD